MDYGDGQTQGYAFDAMGNRLGKTDSNAAPTNSTYDAANRLVSCTKNGTTITYTYGAAGL